MSFFCNIIFSVRQITIYPSFTILIISSDVNLKCFNNSFAGPDFPNSSFIPILVSFAGYSSVRTSDIAVP